MIKKGESLFIPFIKCAGVPDAHYKARTYKSVDACRKALKRDFDKVEIVEYAPVKHARWEKDKDDMFWGNSFIHMRCSLCGSEAHLNRFGMTYIISQFCPNCGARMDGKEDGKDENA